MCVRVRMPKISLGIMGLHEILGPDYGIENPIGDPLSFVT